MKLKSEKGYTLIEIMFVVGLTLTGFAILLSAQINTIKGVAMSRDLSAATNLAEHFLETVGEEAIMWTRKNRLPAPAVVPLPLLSPVGPAVKDGGSEWLPAYPGFDDGTGDARVNANGADTTWDAGIQAEVQPNLAKRFCVQYKVTWVIPDYLIRVDTRVLWLKNQEVLDEYKDCPLVMANDTLNVMTITVPRTLMVNSFVAETP